ncbi:MAG: hypothetical protein ACLTZT_01155 [Butyricimonas faecalis]
MFEKLLAAVMSRLGITSFEEKDGKYVLTEEQKVSLAKMYNWILRRSLKKTCLR